MKIINQMGDAVAKRVKNGFDAVDERVLAMRRRLLRQAAQDMRDINAD